MGLEWSGNETHQEVRVVKVKKLVHEVEDTQESSVAVTEREGAGETPEREEIPFYLQLNSFIDW